VYDWDGVDILKLNFLEERDGKIVSNPNSCSQDLRREKTPGRLSSFWESDKNNAMIPGQTGRKSGWAEEALETHCNEQVYLALTYRNVEQL
jgi:hypothetical protein